VFDSLSLSLARPPPALVCPSQHTLIFFSPFFDTHTLTSTSTAARTPHSPRRPRTPQTTATVATKHLTEDPVQVFFFCIRSMTTLHCVCVFHASVSSSWRHVSCEYIWRRRRTNPPACIPHTTQTPYVCTRSVCAPTLTFVAWGVLFLYRKSPQHHALMQTFSICTFVRVKQAN
jgi:hypothetical protein